MRLGHLAATSLLATALAASAASPALAASAASPALAAGSPSARAASAGTGVPGDIDGDGTPDVVQGVGNYLGAFPVGASAFTASTQAAAPESSMTWGQYAITHRGSLTGGNTDDLVLLNPGSHHVYVYPNDAEFGGTPGHFTHKDKVLTVAKPATCAAGDCTGYDQTWNSTTQILATDGGNGANTQPALITVENGKLWYYPAAKSGPSFGNPVLLGTGDWSGTSLIAPGKVGGVPTLWVRGSGETGAIDSFPLTFKADGTPTTVLTAPLPQPLQNGLVQTDGTHLCLSAFPAGATTGHVPLTLAACSNPMTAHFQFGNDGTVHAWGDCLDAATAGLSTCDSRDSEQHWQPGNYGSLVDSASGKCFGFPPVIFTDSLPSMASCDVSQGQRFGAAGGDTPGPLPGRLDLLPGSYYQTGTSGGPVTSAGDADGTGNPALLWDFNGRVYSYPGLPPVNGVAQLSPARIPLGSDLPYSMTAPGDLLALQGIPGDVSYGPCAKLTMQEDGNLVYSDYQGKVLWSTGTAGHPNAAAAWDPAKGLVVQEAGQTLWSAGPATLNGRYLALTSDCDLVVKDQNGKALWGTGSYEPAHDPNGYGIAPGTTLHAGSSLPGTTGVHLQVTATGDLELVGTDGKLLWTAGTYGHPGAYATLQTDGDLVLQDAAGNPLWSSRTGGHPGDHLTVQNDTNLVIFDADDTPLWSRGTSGAAFAAGSSLASGQSLQGQRARLTMQADGNLVLYSQATGRSLWSTGTWGHPGATATLQADGNLVVYGTGHNSLWSTGTWGHPGGRAILLDTADLAVLDSLGNQLWHSGTDVTGPLYRGAVVNPGDRLPSGYVIDNSRYQGTKLSMQADGNLVLYGSSGRSLWSTGTWGHPGATAAMQADGNFVLSGTDRNSLWSTGTWGHPGAYAVVQYDSNVVLYDADGRSLWSTGTWMQH
ncbi:hypothetical protein P3T35_003326 [Kitasatospora sp. GP30]|uniref:hypothetical protein n=1 Tax=Kitasatospora sp. GP30 TaxID=3035084 RepID=UPI000C706599|nr:hypothetical protein [Kitasatospora sp. GP30]MDH6141309.1 hypothetical protein [Kitasatospora sp. GP30]